MVEKEDNEDDEDLEKSDEIPEEPPSKRKRVLTISDKITMLYKLENGTSPAEISRQYGMSTSAISRMRKKKMDYLSKTTKEISMQQKNLRITQNRVLEDITYAWLCQKIYLGEPVNGPTLCEKALVLNEKMNGPSTFKASNGWLYRFKRRHGIRQWAFQNEKVTVDDVQSEQFVKDLKKFIDFHTYESVNIYNVDETGLNWKSLPEKNKSSEKRSSKSEDKERITVGFCANATGTHRVPALVISSQEKYTCSSDFTCLPVVYKSQAKSQMDSALFIDWYTNHFMPVVRLEQEKTGNTGKVLLLLDNAPCHSSAPLLNSMDEHFAVMYLPPNVTVALQPMSQGIIRSVKDHYREALTSRLLISSRVVVDEFIDNLTIKDCCEMIASSWQRVPASMLSKTWELLLPDLSITRDKDLPSSSGPALPKELASRLNQLKYFCVTEADIEAWLCEDSDDHGWAPLTDEQLIDEAIGAETFHVNINIKCEPEEEVIQEEKCYSAQDALSAINIVYKWYEKQSKCILDDLMILNKIRNTAMETAFKKK
ncbi:jerky protein homolog-like isoform X2 [Venturia canescens]|uniref:jerky protein homolog-like isoform X2 n=1 Tax=Venturia canescens TaxID=32260 RepID=UPI001C9D4FE2|nr:jerky protein homolog-like isoform X2 [Venturia canescens]